MSNCGFFTLWVYIRCLLCIFFQLATFCFNISHFIFQWNVYSVCISSACAYITLQFSLYLSPKQFAPVALSLAQFCICKPPGLFPQFQSCKSLCRWTLPSLGRLAMTQCKDLFTVEIVGWILKFLGVNLHEYVSVYAMQQEESQPCWNIS